MHVEQASLADGDTDVQDEKGESTTLSSNCSAGHVHPVGTLHTLQLSHNHVQYLGLNSCLLFSSVSN